MKNLTFNTNISRHTSAIWLTLDSKVMTLEGIDKAASVELYLYDSETSRDAPDYICAAQLTLSPALKFVRPSGLSGEWSKYAEVVVTHSDSSTAAISGLGKVTQY